MTALVFFSELPEDDDCGLVAPNCKSYEFVIDVEEDMLILSDSIGRSVPFDITQIDCLLDALFKARSYLLVPKAPDAFISMGC